MTGMQLRLELRLSQQLVMTPQLQMAIKLLQLNRLELAETVREEILENPLLEDESETVAARNVEPASAPAASTEREAQDVDWARYLDQYLGAPPAGGHRPSGEDLPSAEATLTRAESLSEHLARQLRLSDLCDDDVELGLVILGNLDESGYLQQPLSEIAAQVGVALDHAEAVLEKLQTFDPAGIGGRSLRECLLIQAIYFQQDDDLVVKIIKAHLADVERRAYARIARALGAPIDEIHEAVRVIASFNPHPGREYTAEEPRHITPDVYIHKVGNQHFVVPNDDGMPKLRISSTYRASFRDNGAAKQYVQDKLRSAQWLIRSIQQRRRTIIRVTESILKFQSEFFDKGVSHLKPLILRDVAEDISMHESTISRVTSNKYVETPQGIYPLKFFFSTGVPGTNGVEVASQAVKLAIKKLLAAEVHDRPLSDQRIVAALRTQGIEIARRTVAKYREQMGILSSSGRRQLL